MGPGSIPCESGHPQLLRGPEHGGNPPMKEGAGGSSSAQRALDEPGSSKLNHFSTFRGSLEETTELSA